MTIFKFLYTLISSFFIAGNFENNFSGAQLFTIASIVNKFKLNIFALLLKYLVEIIFIFGLIKLFLFINLF